MRYVLSQFDYAGKEKALTTLFPDPNIVMRYFRSTKQLDYYNMERYNITDTDVVEY